MSARRAGVSGFRWLLWWAIPLGLLVVAANAHLVYVAVKSQPECVPHEKAMGDANGFRAAKSAC